jgi:hypothetical protein
MRTGILAAWYGGRHNVQYRAAYYAVLRLCRLEQRVRRTPGVTDRRNFIEDSPPPTTMPASLAIMPVCRGTVLSDSGLLLNGIGWTIPLLKIPSSSLSPLSIAA